MRFPAFNPLVPKIQIRDLHKRFDGAPLNARAGGWAANARAWVRYVDQDPHRTALLDGAEHAVSEARAMELLGRLGVAERALEFMSKRLSSRVAFGRPLSDLLGQPFTDIIRKRIGNDESEERTLGFSLSSRTPFTELTVQAAVPGSSISCTSCAPGGTWGPKPSTW